MADEFPDLHHKMSKKIAQLTKVIFHLNTKTDENDYNIRNIVQTYEQEMDIITQNANQIIQKYKDAMDKSANNDEVEKNFNEFQDKIESDKNLALMEFKTFQKKVEEREKQTQIDADKKLDIYKREIDTMKMKFENLQKGIEKFSLNSDELKNSHKKELGDYVKQQNEKS